MFVKAAVPKFSACYVFSSTAQDSPILSGFIPANVSTVQLYTENPANFGVQLPIVLPVEITAPTTATLTIPALHNSLENLQSRLKLLRDDGTLASIAHVPIFSV